MTNNTNTGIEALQKLIDRVGSQEKVAEKLTEHGYKIGQSAIALWISRGAVSRLFAVHIEEVFGSPKKHQLCPEHFKKPKRVSNG